MFVYRIVMSWQPTKTLSRRQERTSLHSERTAVAFGFIGGNTSSEQLPCSYKPTLDPQT